MSNTYSWVADYIYQDKRREAGITRETTLHSLLFTPTMLQDFTQTTGVATRGWPLQRAEEREGEKERGWGRLRGARGRSCGEVEGARAEVVFPLSLSFVNIFLLSFCLFFVFFPTFNRVILNCCQWTPGNTHQRVL